MLKHASKAAPPDTKVEVVTADPQFERAVRDIFASGRRSDFAIVTGTVSAHEEDLGGDGTTVVVADIDAGDDKEIAALERLATRLAGWPPIVAVTASFDRDLVRRLVQMRIADFLVKPVQPAEFLGTCARVVKAPKSPDRREAEIYTYIPAIGLGVGSIGSCLIPRLYFCIGHHCRRVHFPLIHLKIFIFTREKIFKHFAISSIGTTR